MKSKTFYYFSYGSNMLLRRLCAENRAPSAKPIATGYLEGRRLTTNKISIDGSGKCDASITNIDTDRVYGVIFEIKESEKDSLNRAEGLGSGYKEEEVKVVIEAERRISATAYIATSKEENLQPYRWYKALVVKGAIENNLPCEYIEWLRTMTSKEDPDSGRRSKNEALLFDN